MINISWEIVREHPRLFRFLVHFQVYGPTLLYEPSFHLSFQDLNPLQYSSELKDRDRFPLSPFPLRPKSR